MKKVVSFKLEPHLVEYLDNVIRKLGYQSRGQFIREAIFWYLAYKRAELRGYQCLCKCGDPHAKCLDDFYDPELDELEAGF